MTEFLDSFEEEEPAPEDATCDRCGATGLVWLDTGVRNRLFDEHGKPHHCVAKAADFEDLTNDC